MPPRSRSLSLLVLFISVGGGSAVAQAPVPSLEIRFVGNAGVLLHDGTTTLLIDLPY